MGHSVHVLCYQTAARLIEFEGMGHNLPERVWDEVFDAIEELARQASADQPR